MLSFNAKQIHGIAIAYPFDDKAGICVKILRVCVYNEWYIRYFSYAHKM